MCFAGEPEEGEGGQGVSSFIIVSISISIITAAFSLFRLLLW